MDQQIHVKAQTLYGLARQAGLITSEPFSTVFSQEILRGISEMLDRERTFLIHSKPKTEDPEKLWKEGIDLKISELVAQELLDFLQNIHKAFSVAYDQPVEDVVFNFRTVSEDLSISDLGEKQENGKWFQGMKIDEETFWYLADEPALVQDTLHDINQKLSPLSKGILRADFRDQDQYVVIDLKHLPEFEKFGFSSVS
ncbi:hypothetical protein A3K29_02625 [Candidatus Collierbacteria bacterium RIFOXYB2_FULL_46_14]|uniref:Uncharacterized protein n=1 Tax=Candidatus Collierbacteria bacterium GW2011_GWA2_46_26 TaxID=1618381 RepID=A0A0G1RVB2_9BACT|nr:MAG: hypothetical protein UW29_C0004G0030 [Candidatus Collierbacteria bacterium GW2011_GWC2_44_13]KKU33918.1 MAG: hypothetical protein UX47_C0001G0201 [Candidatus Collierbacteria bacterium GW2011_GWA2_46_26]OGD73014.1 MAG: hypothetical protein A3K29_02625 [Candidatus Collierbacteria bacterium RIFOXYB2_FULL_46_14]OGD76056.1 MAG: hypothetical protein A3K43_02625 [Candidatus Collierbacteria bacterium RIFOXYA2_FULL_46_20]OGD77392.1 MAG: hypothetical protein A3K39_02625 [Candidatus Collierbacteri